MNIFSTHRFGLLACFFFLCFTVRTAAQNTPICFQLFFPTVAAQAGDTVCLPMMVRDFNLIASMQLGIHWDTTALKLINIDDSPSGLPDFGSLNYNNLYPGHVPVSWNAQGLMGITIPDSSILFNLCFRVNNTAVIGLNPLIIGDLVITSARYEVVQMLPPDWHSVMMPLAQQIGGVLVGAGPVNNLAVASTCVVGSVCNAPVGSASVEITGGEPPYQYAWSGPFGFSASTSSISNVSGGEYRVTITDQTGSTVMAEVSVTSSNSGMWTTKQLTNATCEQANGCATLTVFGGQLPYSFAWSNGASQTNQNCALAPGQQSVLITDALGCSIVTNFEMGNSSDFYLSGYAQHISECGGTGSARITITGSDGPFQLLWSTGDTTYITSGLSEGAYTVTVTGPGNCVGEATVNVSNQYTNNWGLYLYAYCDNALPNTGKVVLTTAYINPPIGFPITLAWSDGTTRVIPAMPSTNKLDSLLAVPSGFYSVNVTDSTGCSRSLDVSLDCANMPPVPDGLPAFYIKDEYLNLQYAIDSCAGVYARNFTDISALSFSLDWYAAEVSNIRKLNLPGLSFADFTLNQQDAKLGINWESPVPVTLPVESLLFEVCFTPTNSSKTANLEFSDTPTDVQLLGAQGEELDFIGKKGYVMFDLYFPLQPSICDFGVIPPDCTFDGNSHVLLGQCNPGLSLEVHNYTINPSQYVGDIGSLLSMETGKYRVTASQAASEYQSFFIKIVGSEDSTHCVWPGDADNNNAVNHYDLLYLGLAYGEQGLERTSASQDWYGQDCPDWVEETEVRNVNFKNIDVNGDGLINASDTIGIVQNWGRVINPNLDNPFAAPFGNSPGNLYPTLTLETDTLEAGQSIGLPISLGSADMPMDSLYGLAFSIAYDPKVVKDNVRFQPSSSWFGDSTEFLFLQKNFPEQGHLDVAITRTDRMPVSGWGDIGKMFIIIEDNIFGDPDPLGPPDTTLKTMLYFRGLSSVNDQEKPKAMDAPPVELVIQRTTSSVKDIPVWERAIALSPNPANETLRISSREARLERVELTDMTGRLAFSQMFGQQEAQFATQHLPIGTYFVRIFTERGIAVRKLTIVH